MRRNLRLVENAFTASLDVSKNIKFMRLFLHSIIDISNGFSNTDLIY